MHKAQMDLSLHTKRLDIFSSKFTQRFPDHFPGSCIPGPFAIAILYPLVLDQTVIIESFLFHPDNFEALWNKTGRRVLNRPHDLSQWLNQWLSLRSLAVAGDLFRR